MEVQQCMKFTGTNSSIGLIVLIINAHRFAMFSYRSRLFRPSGGAARARRISADGRSALRSFAS
jgi:hypothetical protein